MINANANNFYVDTIPIGIMNFAFYGLKPDAMTTGNYFNFDTINNVLSDKYPRPSYPYTDDNIMFMSAPLKSDAAFDFVTFIYDDTNGPAGHLGFYGNTIGTFAQIDEPLLNCCTRFLGLAT